MFFKEIFLDDKEVIRLYKWYLRRQKEEQDIG